MIIAPFGICKPLYSSSADTACGSAIGTVGNHRKVSMAKARMYGICSMSLASDVALTASVNLDAVFGRVVGGKFSEGQLGLLREQVKVAHEKGIKARYWNQPEWPIADRNAVWRTLWNEGVDILNVDDLKGAAEFWDGRS